MSDKAFVDTNILVYSYEKISSDQEKCKICLDIVLRCFRGEMQLSVSNQILAEFFHVSTRKSEHPLTGEEAKSLIGFLLLSTCWTKVNYDIHTLFNAVEIATRYSLKIWDALIAATMIENNIFTIYTENEKDFLKIPGITVINPFKEKHS